jgi:hypothetical protein
MTQEEYDALKSGDVVYTASAERSGTIIGVVVEARLPGVGSIVVWRPNSFRQFLYSSAYVRGVMHTTPEKCRDAMVAEIKAEADSHQASAAALYKKAEKAARRSYTVLHVPPRTTSDCDAAMMKDDEGI